MKKVHNLNDVPRKESEELSKKLYRSVKEQCWSLDEVHYRVCTNLELFNSDLIGQRQKFWDSCKRLIFEDPLRYGLKVEELLWRTGFYGVYTTAKRLKTEPQFSDQEYLWMRALISAGLGLYHFIILKCSIQFEVDLRSVTDWVKTRPPKRSYPERIYDTSKIIRESRAAQDFAKQMVHRCLIHLGDLARYETELGRETKPTLAIRYYMQAVAYRPDQGMPHNQMGTMAMNHKDFLSSAYHYLLGLACEVPFEGTLHNLQNLFEQNSKFIEQLPPIDKDCIVEPDRSENIQRLIARFLLLIDISYFNKKVSNGYYLCHQICKNLEECLAYEKPGGSESGVSPTNEVDNSGSEPTYLTGQMVFKIVAICLLAISKLKADNSGPLSTMVAFTLNVYSQMVQKLANHIEEAVLKYPLSERGRTIACGMLSKIMGINRQRLELEMRRRRPARRASDGEDDDSDLSENELNSIDNSSSSESDDESDDDVHSFTSDISDLLDHSSDEENDEDGSSDISNAKTGEKEKKNKEYVLEKVQKMGANVMLEIVNESGLLESVLIVHEWLKSDVETLKSCTTNTKPLIKQIVDLVNLLNIDFGRSKSKLDCGLKHSEVVKMESKIPLFGNAVLRGVALLRPIQDVYDWNFFKNHDTSTKDEIVIKVVKVLNFGKLLAKLDDSSVVYIKERNVLRCQMDEKSEAAIASAAALKEQMERQDNPSKKLTNGGPLTADNLNLNKMKHMGQLWLAAEVQDLESRVDASNVSLSPYLVLDAEALSSYSRMVRQLVHSREFIIIVPTAVISALDDMKGHKRSARDAIRWLESQFHRGNRFFRSQRPHERTAIPLVKYPKKRDNDTQNFIEMIECCHYLAEQQKGAANVVTFLVGGPSLNAPDHDHKKFSYAGVAQSVGIVLEHITTFYAKWKTSKR